MSSPKKKNVLKVVAVIKKGKDTEQDEDEGTGWPGPRRTGGAVLRPGKKLAARKAGKEDETHTVRNASSTTKKAAPRKSTKTIAKKATKK